MSWKLRRRTTVKAKLRQRERRMPGKKRKHTHLEQQLLLHVGAFRETKNPPPIDLEGRAVAAFAEMFDTGRGDRRKLRPYDRGDLSNVDVHVEHRSGSSTRLAGDKDFVGSRLELRMIERHRLGHESGVCQ